ncbi:hypothetical protein EJ076_16680 [Mesorhizobium sp. M7D.F.Ca.US.005.01.1.1]|nr:hypothetical protein EJ076_16680 [Mesorhizobium sp. M7D.F.Ca.US.005.01.1.1]RUX86740.1 hypothetical protein EN993_34445 [Mesorhizobium sp. M7D.F.Ca.US.004.01.2.1]RVA25029.1 hypothetical protein EN935_25075 [Mesorhizobium sp. M7D.F.Ca.US.004.03.1.1]
MHLGGHITAPFASILQYILAERQSMMPKSAKRFSRTNGYRLSRHHALYLFDLETDSDFGSIRPEIIRL